jgi:hypothetical protein
MRRIYTQARENEPPRTKAPNEGGQYLSPDPGSAISMHTRLKISEHTVRMSSNVPRERDGSTRPGS